MRSLNRMLTLIAVAVLAVTIALLIWMRGRATQSLEEIMAATAEALDYEEILHEPTDARAEFIEAAEFVERQKKSNPYVRDLVLSKARAGYPEGRDENPIVPAYLFTLHGWAWRDRLAGMERRELSTDGRVYGYLYFDLDRWALMSVNYAIGAATLALIAALGMLLVRVYSQETSLVTAGSELAQRKRELIRLERLALAGQLSAGLLHDLKKPISHIRHSLEDLRRALGDFGGASAAVADIRDQTDLFFTLLSDSQMERFVRSDRVQEEYVDLNEILEIALKLVQYEKGAVEVTKRLGEGLAPVLAQPFRLIQVFSNLMLNAYQAMGGQGRLEVATETAEGGVEARVTDWGPGIETDVIDSIFDPFFTTKSEAEGSGLGLAISRLIIEELGGTIEVESAPGGPTAFIVRLPHENEPAE